MLNTIVAGSMGLTQQQLMSFLQSGSIDQLGFLSSQHVSYVLADATLAEGPLLSFVNGMWIEQSLCLQPPFKKIAATDFKVPLASVYFATKSVIPPIVWRRPDQDDEVVLNVDGSSYKNIKRAGYGIIIRNYQGEWIKGVSAHIDYANSLQVELIAILEGLKLAWDNEDVRKKKVNCRTDCLQAFNFFNDRHLQPFDYVAHEVDCIKDLVSRDWIVSIEHILREANQCANKLAKLGATKGTEIFDKSPIFLYHIFEDDKSGKQYARRT